jgi:hypothetical protein
MTRTTLLAAAALATLAAVPALHAQEDDGGSVIDIDIEGIDTEAPVERIDTLSGVGRFTANDVFKFGEDNNGSVSLIPADVFGENDPNLTARAGVLLQARAAIVYYEDVFEEEEFDVGLEQSRIKPFVFGTFGPEEGIGFIKGPAEFRLQGSIVPNGGTFVMEDAYVLLPVGDSMAVRVGQFQNPVSRERTMLGGYNLAVERSLAAESFGAGGRVQGVSLVYVPGDEPRLRGEVGITDGQGSANTPVFDTESDLGAAGRVEYLIGGNWDDYTDFTALGTTEGLLVAGAGADLTLAGDTLLLTATADAQYENTDGLSGYGAVFTSLGQFDGEGTFNLALVAQAGQMMDDNVELVGRAALMLLDEDTNPSDEDLFLELTGGVNYYFQPQGFPHRLKASLDVNILPNGTPGGPQLDYVPSNDLQFVVRGQLQLLL